LLHSRINSIYYNISLSILSPPQVKLVLAYCILHNWILGSGEDKLFLETVVSDQVETYHGVEQSDNEAWKSKRMEWTTAMWDAIGSTTIYEEEE
jgi:hypothetical protein